MAIEKWPYSNFHDLNLDYMLNKMSSVEQNADAAARSATEAANSETNAADSATAAASSEENAEHWYNLTRNFVGDLGSEIGTVVGEWLDEHVDPATGYVIDDTLTISNAAADSAVVGNRFDLTNAVLSTFRMGTYDHETVLFTDTAVSVGDLFYYSFTANTGYSGMICFYDETDNRLAAYGKTSSASGDLEYEGTGIIPENFSYAKVVASAGQSPSNIHIKWLSNIPTISSRFDAVEEDLQEQIDAGYLRDNLFSPLMLNWSGRGVTVRSINDTSFDISGTASGTISRLIGTADLEIGNYIISGYVVNSTNLLQVLNSGNTPVGDTFYHDGAFSVTEAGTYNINLRLGTGTTIDEVVTPILYSADTLSNKQLSEKVDGITPIITNANFYNDYTILKNRPYPLDGYDYVAFSSGVMWYGKEVFAARASSAHVTPSSPADWGKIVFHVIDEDGSITHQFLDIDYSTMPGELRDPDLSITRDGQLILSCATTDNYSGTAVYSSAIFLLDQNLEVLSYATEIVNPGDYMFGNMIQTPTGYLLKSAYTATTPGAYTVKIYRSTTAFEDDVTNLAFSEVLSLETGSGCTEATIGYTDTQLICIVREQQNNAHMYTTEDLEGLSGWSNSTDLTYGAETFILHSPVMLPYNDNHHIIFAGSKKDINSTARSPILGYLDTDTGKILTYAEMYHSETASGYPGLIKLGNYNYSAVYYVDQIPGTSYHYRRFDTIRMLNTSYV